MGSPYGIAQTFDEALTTTTSTASVELGTIRYEGSTKYRYFYNKSTSTILTGCGAVASASTGFSVTVTTVTGDMPACVAHTEAGPEKYFWGVVQGTTPIEIGDTVIGDLSCAIGQGVALMSLGKWYGVTTGATGSTWAFTVAGVSLEAPGTNQSGAAHVKCYTA